MIVSTLVGLLAFVLLYYVLYLIGSVAIRFVPQSLKPNDALEVPAFMGFVVVFIGGCALFLAYLFGNCLLHL